MDFQTIAAIATPPGKGGIGIIKISGNRALNVLAAVFAPGKRDTALKTGPVNDPAFFSPWRMHYGHILDSENNRVYDEVIVAVMAAPHSYTREDIAEIQAHGGTIVLEGILSLLFSKGVRLAEPGEFTRRAFINGRIDLAQAEAVIDIVNAKNDTAADIAFNQSAGRLSSEIDVIREVITGSLAAIEAMIDFPDDTEPDTDLLPLAQDLSRNALEPVTDLIFRHEQCRSLREGFRIVIAGPPNVGKSSLMNRLANQDRSIVTDIPGTTRDFIESDLYLKDHFITLVDTAGLRADPDPIEEIGIQKALSLVRDADLLLFLIDASDPEANTEPLFPEEMLTPDKPVIMVYNKTDLTDSTERLAPPPALEGFPSVDVSAKNNTGIEPLKQTIVETLRNRYPDNPGQPVPNYRHKMLLQEAKRALEQSVDHLFRNSEPELISLDLRLAHDRIGEITGATAPPAVLDAIFRQYCIGK